MNDAAELNTDKLNKEDNTVNCLDGDCKDSSADEAPESVYDFNPQQCMSIIKAMSLKGINAMDDMDFMEAVHTYIVCSGRYIQHLEYRVAALDQFVSDLDYCFNELQKDKAENASKIMQSCTPPSTDIMEADASECSSKDSQDEDE